MNEHEHNPETTPTPEVPVTDEVETTSAESSDASVTPEVVETTETNVDSQNEKMPDIESAAHEESEAVSETNDTESASAATGMAAVTTKLRSLKRGVMKYKYTIIAAILVIVGLLGFTYMMEQEGRIQTGLFDGLSNLTASYKAVALVNEEKVSQKELNISVSQLEMGAAAQGIDVTDPATQDQIKTQALDMLVNTELLKQEAEARGINITEEDVATRLTTLKEEIGGEEVLMERMKQFGVDEKTLQNDIKNELTIQALLDQVFAEKGLEVTEEEITAFYDEAGGADAGLPALEEVRAQIEAQLKNTKQQDAVTAYIEELRAKSTIEILI